MAQYKVVNQRVEVNGVTKEIGAILEESDFKLVVAVPEEGVKAYSELTSLLATGHVVENE